MVKRIVLLIIALFLIVVPAAAQDTSVDIVLTGSCEDIVRVDDPSNDSAPVRYIGSYRTDVCWMYEDGTLGKLEEPTQEQGYAVLSPNGTKIAYNNYQDPIDDQKSQVWMYDLVSEQSRQILPCDDGCLTIEWLDDEKVIVLNQLSGIYNSVDIQTEVITVVDWPEYVPFEASISPYDDESYVKYHDRAGYQLTLDGEEVSLFFDTLPTGESVVSYNGNHVTMAQPPGEEPILILFEEYIVWLPDGSVLVLYGPGSHDEYVYLYQITLDGKMTSFGPSNIGWTSIAPS